MNNTGPDLLPLQTSKITRDWVYWGLNATEKLAIWEHGECTDSLHRLIKSSKQNDTETYHHYCEEFWFKTSVDIKLNMTAIQNVIDDVIDNYFPTLGSSLQQSSDVGDAATSHTFPNTHLPEDGAEPLHL